MYVIYNCKIIIITAPGDYSTSADSCNYGQYIWLNSFQNTQSVYSTRVLVLLTWSGLHKTTPVCTM